MNAVSPRKDAPMFLKKLSCLARTFGQPLGELQSQFWDIHPYAQAHQRNHACGSKEAWRAAILATGRRSFDRARHPVSCLLHVFVRLLCFLPSTSAVEQSFGKILAILGFQRLNAGACKESRAIALLLVDLTEAEEVQLCKEAQILYAQALFFVCWLFLLIVPQPE